MAVLDFQPYAFVEKFNFQKFAKKLDLLNQIRSNQNLKSVLLNNRHIELSLNIKKLIEVVHVLLTI